MPTKPSRARRWVQEGKAVGKFNKLGIYYVQLIGEPSDFNTQDIAIGLDPGKMFSGVAVQSSKFTDAYVAFSFTIQKYQKANGKPCNDAAW